jgi:hypothetical protein
MSRDGERRTLHLISPLRCVSNLGAIIQVNMRTQEDNNRNKVNGQEKTILSRGSTHAYSTLW